MSLFRLDQSSEKSDVCMKLRLAGKRYASPPVTLSFNKKPPISNNVSVYPKDVTCSEQAKDLCLIYFSK